ncbi:MAG: putative oxidoreductase C-terminal domain-containing protein [Gemmataceae bacterium]|nr:hypothetical protein [Gemmata sp.]MDW8196109.1 putative oxidoreductase C-terminal domain-containing protein [Gemmataceae bacterium]
MGWIRFITLAPGHFHAALVQKYSRPGVHPRVHVYGPLDDDTLAHCARIARFNHRPDNPTAWELEVHACSDYLERFVREQPGNTVVLSGRNRPKIGWMEVAVANGLHVLADKPWIIEPDDFPRLQRLLHAAEQREVIVWDILTERWEITNWLQREFVRDPDIFGTWQVGTPEEPGLVLRSVHFLNKLVSGQPLLRPWWWFDRRIAGEAMADVGTHLADLALGLVAPDQAVDFRNDIQMLSATQQPLGLSEDQFRHITGLRGFVPELEPYLQQGQLVYCGDQVATFRLRGVYVRLNTVWEWQSPGSDMHECTARGTRSIITIRQQPSHPPELSVSARHPSDHAELMKQLRQKCLSLQREFAGLSVADRGYEGHIQIPEHWRSNHEDHFAAVLDDYIRYAHDPSTIPSWEKSQALARYFITTQAVTLLRAGQERQPPDGVSTSGLAGGGRTPPSSS